MRLIYWSLRSTATFVICFHRSLLLAFSLHFSSSSAFLRSLFTQSAHLSCGLPRFLEPSCFFFSALFASLSSFILTMWPAHCMTLIERIRDQRVSSIACKPHSFIRSSCASTNSKSWNKFSCSPVYYVSRNLCPFRFQACLQYSKISLSPSPPLSPSLSLSLSPSSSSGRRSPDVSANLVPVLRHSACRCHRTERICDVFLPSLSWISLASFPGYHSLIIVFSKPLWRVTWPKYYTCVEYKYM